MKLAPSSKVDFGTYTADKIKVIGCCTLLAVHPDTQCLKEVIFHVTSNEGSVVLSCVTTLELCVIQPCSNLDSISSSASLIRSKANYPRKKRSQKNMLVSKPKKNVCSSKEQSHFISQSEEYHVNQCVMYEDKEEKSNQECQAHVISMEDDKNFQSSKYVHLGSVKPAMRQSAYMKFNQKSLCGDKKCQSTKSVKSVCDDKNCQSTLCSDKNCQDTRCVHRWPAMKSSYVWSVICS